jgi:hypothetical protein
MGTRITVPINKRLIVPIEYRLDLDPPTGLWTPTNMTTVAWYDASDDSSLTYADVGGLDLVSAVANKGDGGSGWDLGQTSDSNKFETNLNTIGGLNTLYSDGTDHMFVTGRSLPTSGNFMMIGVASFDNVSVAGDSFCSFNDDIDGTKEFNCRSGYTTGGNYWGEISSTGLHTGSSNTGKPSTSHSFAVYGHEFDFSNSEMNMWFTGVISDGANEPLNYTTKPSNSGTFRINSNKGGSSQPRGDWCEMVLCEAVDTTSRQILEGYFAWKWDGGVSGTLVGQLPAGHPYKSAAPTA